MKLKDLKKSAWNGADLGDGVRVWHKQGDRGYTPGQIVVSCGGANMSTYTDDAMTEVSIETIRSFAKDARELAAGYLAIAEQLDKVTG